MNAAPVSHFIQSIHYSLPFIQWIKWMWFHEPFHSLRCVNSITFHELNDLLRGSSLIPLCFTRLQLLSLCFINFSHLALLPPSVHSRSFQSLSFHSFGNYHSFHKSFAFQLTFMLISLLISWRTIRAACNRSLRFHLIAVISFVALISIHQFTSHSFTPSN